MGKKSNRYTQMRQYMTLTLLANAGLFILYLVFAGFGVIWMKAITAVLSILLSSCCLVFLYLCKELLRRRSLWMTAAAAALLICTLASLILNYPSPVS